MNHNIIFEVVVIKQADSTLRQDTNTDNVSHTYSGTSTPPSVFPDAHTTSLLPFTIQSSTQTTILPLYIQLTTTKHPANHTQSYLSQFSSTLFILELSILPQYV